MIDFSTFKKSEYEYDYSIFGTPVLLTAAYGAAYLLMIIVCVVVYTMLNSAWKQKQVSAVQC